MKIQNQNLIQQDLTKLQTKKPVETTKDAAALQTPMEKVSISPEAINFKQIEADVKAVPDVRMDLVNRIKSEVAAGTYNRPADKVAEAMISTSLIESIYR